MQRLATRARARGPALRGAAALALGVATALALQWLTPLPERLDQGLYDLQVRLVRALRPPVPLPPAAEPVIVGLDDATLAAIEVPLAMIHRELGAALEGIAAAGPRTTAIDLALPGRSYDGLVPGLDWALMRGLVALRQSGGVVFVLDADADGRLRMPHAPLLAAAGGWPALGSSLYPVDSDGVVRRFDPRPAGDGLPSFGAVIAARLGIAARAAEAGWIDYTRGDTFHYVPLGEVVRWQEAGDLGHLRQAFGGRVVLLGAVLPYQDHWSQPVDLVGWRFPAAAPPGVLIHAQLLRSLMGDGLVRSLPPAAVLLLALLLGAPAVLGGLARRWVLLAAGIVASLALATGLLAAGWRLAPGVPWIAGMMAVGVRTTLDVAAARRERARLLRTFGGYVSPQLLRAILAGDIDAGGGRRAMAFLFADLRGFTAWSERTAPEEVLEVLNRYYAAITPVIHGRGGTIDNFRGDGIMVMFGAPDPHPDACSDAFGAARDLLAAVERLNREDLAGRGVRLQVAVGLAWGEAVYGDLGGSERKDFTALGDAVNVAARLQELSKTLGYPVIMSAALAERIEPAAGVAAPQALGEAKLTGHSPVAIAGWRPPA